MAHTMHRAAAVLAALAPLVAAQGYFGGDASATCGLADTFQSLGCYQDGLVGFGTSFNIYIGQYNPANPSYSTNNPFPGLVHNTNYDNTMVPYTCAMACRGYGYAFSAIRADSCYCSPVAPPPALAGGVCNYACDADITQTCGGTAENSFNVYGDPSFANPILLANYPPGSLDQYYQYLGCYYRPNFGQALEQLEDGIVSSCQASYTACATHCSTNGYALAGVEYSPSGSLTSVCTDSLPISCLCGTSFGSGSYRVDETEAPYDGLCGVDCATGDACDPTTDKCCGSNYYYPVYINPELTGCYEPQIPGFGILSGSALLGFYCAPDPASNLIGGPKVIPAGGSYYASTTDIDETVPDHPVEVDSGVEGEQDTYYLMGCFANCPALNVLEGSVLQGTSIGGLAFCAAQCATQGLPYFAIGNGGAVCYCGTGITAGCIIGPMSSCNSRCLNNIDENCGGPGFGPDVVPVVYGPADAFSEGPIYSSLYTTYTATPMATYACDPLPSSPSVSSPSASSPSVSSPSASSPSVSSPSASSPSVSSPSVSSPSVTSPSVSSPSVSSPSVSSPSVSSPSVSSPSVSPSVSSPSVSPSSPSSSVPSSSNLVENSLALPFGFFFFDGPVTATAGLECQTVTRSWVPGQTTLLPQ